MPNYVVRQMTILGVIFLWQPHMNKVQGKLNGQLNAFRCIDKPMNINLRCSVLTAFVRPHLTYCQAVWGNSTATSQQSFNQTLKHCARFVLNQT